jgi:hypothetical protein
VHVGVFVRCRCASSTSHLGTAFGITHYSPKEWKKKPHCMSFSWYLAFPIIFKFFITVTDYGLICIHFPDSSESFHLHFTPILTSSMAATWTPFVISIYQSSLRFSTSSPDPNASPPPSHAELGGLLPIVPFRYFIGCLPFLLFWAGRGEGTREVPRFMTCPFTCSLLFSLILYYSIEHMYCILRHL